MSELRESCTRVARNDAKVFLLDADADGFAALSGRPTSLRAVLDETRALREQGHPVCWRIPLIPELVCRLEGLFSLARAEGVEPILSAADPGGRPLDPDQQLFAWDFVHYRILEEEAGRLAQAQRTGYESLERELVQGTGNGATAPSEAPSYLESLLDHPADVAGVLLDGARGLAQWGWARIRQPRRTPPPAGTRTLPRVVLIGAYGGEHIGDGAILGGVLRRIQARYQTTHAVLMSQRPDHSRHLLEMLELPVELRVEAYEHDAIRACLSAADGLVYAGGPLTDIPKQLVRHLYAASIARRTGKPFVIEGIGVGPFPRPPSAWVGRRIAALAERISVRTATDGARPEVRDLRPEIGRDPAFDYLESRGAELTRLPEAERGSLDALFQGTAGRPLIGVNVRPISDLWTQGTPDSLDRAEHTRRIETRFEEQLALGLRRFAETSPVKPCFVFYPMNAIQFGMSDLRSAYRIARRLGDDVDFRVWQRDASLDGVVSLLRRLDVVVAMRFHGAIFALSQGKPLIGIDYRPGEKDKVGFLLGDFDQDENCTRIDQLTSAWLVERLVALSATQTG